MLVHDAGLGLAAPRMAAEEMQSDAPPDAQRLARGVCRMLANLGYETLTEFRLPPRRRADVIGLNGDGRFVIVEIKTTLEDFRADHKWHEYRAWCDALYFAVPPLFPIEILPSDCGVLISDPFGAAIERQAASSPLAAARRRRLMHRFALAAALRLRLIVDPAGERVREGL